MNDIDVLLEAFATLRPRFVQQGDAMAGLAHVVSTALTLLADQVRTEPEVGRDPAPQLVFGGMLQCSPLQQQAAAPSTATPQLAAQCCHEAGTLFAQSLVVWNAHNRQPAAPTPRAGEVPSIERLTTRMRLFGEQLTQSIEQQTTDCRRRAAETQQAILELQRDIESAAAIDEQRHQLHDRYSSLKQRNDSLRAELSEHQFSVADLEAEELRLSNELGELKRLTQRVSDLKRELKELREQLGEAEKEREQISQQTYDLRSKLRDTQSLVEEARRHSPADLLARLERIWNEIPADAFDRLVHS